MTMRGKIAEILMSGAVQYDTTGEGPSAEEAADAIIAALPDMIPDLVWEGNIAQNGMGGRYVISWYDAGDLCTQLSFHSFGNPPTFDHVAGDVFVRDLIAAANTHHRAAIMKSFGLTTPDDAVEGE